MAAFNEDTRVKIPATIQFLKIGYEYQSLKDADIDFQTKIFINRFKPALEEINERDFSYDEIKEILMDINNVIKNNDLGKEFYNWLINPLDKVNIVYNKLLLNHGNSDDMFDYTDESDGTKRLFDLIPIFYENGRGSLILIDEIDRSLHTNLTRKFLELFFKIVEDRECQLIATTHDSNLLDLELLRQDEIWFVERQPDHSSKVFSLNKFKERFDKKIDKEYLLGRYGAIPVFDDDFVLENDYEE